jgi:hypothetical protein
MRRSFGHLTVRLAVEGQGFPTRESSTDTPARAVYGSSEVRQGQWPVLGELPEGSVWSRVCTGKLHPSVRSSFFKHTTHHRQNGETWPPIKAAEPAKLACLEESDVSSITNMTLKSSSLSLTMYTFSAATNAASSPFLKLPAEIRQRIYNYALGGNILHVASHVVRRQERGPGPVVVCGCPHDYEDDTDHSVMRREVSQFEFPSVESSGAIFFCLHIHRECYLEPSAQCFSVHLLQTCRQIYHEGMFGISHIKPILSC